jgi:pimeloyl-ACP methyl ester carboxylesterase
VLGALRIAQDARTSLDSKLIVVGHSLGGVISYDILTYFNPNIQVDVLVTVGSQVALFEEMALYRASRPEFVPDPATDRIARPPNVKRWLNVIDLNDVFSFRAEGVFEGVKDFRYATGYGVMSAHSGYFRRSSFYERLGGRLAQSDS